jgi:membrane protease YdiL (CAAX protease family)
MPWDVLLIFFVLGVAVPWRGRIRMRELLAKPQVRSSERILLYISTIVFQWVATGIAAWRAWAHGWTKLDLGLASLTDGRIVAGGILGAGIIAVVQWFNLRRMGRLPLPSRGRLQALAERVLPQQPREMLVFLLLALTAGCCEEFLYRGFAIAAFSRAGWPIWSAVLASAILFGLAHLYQGRGGAVGTSILGVVFGTARVLYGSVVPAVFWHATVDIVAGVAGPKYLAAKSPGGSQVIGSN